MSNNLILKSKKLSLEIPMKSFGEVVWNRLQELNSESICIIEAKNDRKIKLKDLISRANSIAVALLNRGITKTDRFCCLSANSIEYAVMLFASYFIGITIVPLSPTFAKFELKNEIEMIGPTIIFTSVENANKFDEIMMNSREKKCNIKSIVVFNGYYSDYLPFEKLLKEGENQKLNKIPHFDIDPKNDILFLLRSSGSSGLPKSTMLSHYAFVAILTEYLRSNQFNDLIVSFLYTFGHICGSLFLPTWISFGATLILYDELDFESMLKSVAKYKINLLPIYPYFGLKLIEGEFVDKYDLSSIKMMFTAGGNFPLNDAKAIVDKYNILFQNWYGMTEYGGITEIPNIDNTEFIGENVSHVSQNTELKIIDLTTGHSLGPNIDGEICVRGPKMFSGYLNNISATNEAIDSEGWLHTGDIGHYDQNEKLFITDRLKELIKFGTYNVSPAEIENFLLTHKSIAEVVVVGVKHENLSEWPRAYVKLKKGESVTEEELKKFVAETLSYTKQLRAGVVFVDNIPRISIGKIDRKYFKHLVSNEIIRNKEL